MPPTNTPLPTNTSGPTNTPLPPSQTPTPSATPLVFLPLPQQLTSPIARQPDPARNGIFFTATQGIIYAGGPVWLSRNPDATGNVNIDDMITIQITHPDSSVATFVHDYATIPHAPFDLSTYFQVGNNVVTTTLADDGAGGFYDSTAIWLGVPAAPTATNTFTATNTPVPPTNTPTFTNTPIPPTNTPTHTDTPVPPTNTPIPPTNTPTFTDTPVPPTNTPTFTDTPVPPTNTPTNTDTPSLTPT